MVLKFTLNFWLLLSMQGALEKTPTSILQHTVNAPKLSSPVESRVMADIRNQIMQIDDVSDQIRERTQRAAAEVRQMLFAAAAEEVSIHHFQSKVNGSFERFGCSQESKRTAAERLQAHRDRATAAVQACLSECRQLSTNATGLVNSIRSASEGIFHN
jgi:predicted ATP-grasp superfamily ATP-dependent carboligase